MWVAGRFLGGVEVACRLGVQLLLGRSSLLFVLDLSRRRSCLGVLLRL